MRRLGQNCSSTAGRIRISLPAISSAGKRRPVNSPDPIDMDFDGARIYAIPMTTRFRGITIREGMLVEGPAGWGEFCPFPEYDDREAASWLATAGEHATGGWSEPKREENPVNCTVPAVGPQRAHEITARSG